jgi:hypothetical protein
MSDEKSNVIHIPTQANIKHAFEEGRKEGEAAAQELLANPPTPQQLLGVCRDAAQYDMEKPARETLHKALELLAAHFGGDTTAYYSDTKKVCGFVFVLGIHIQLSRADV